MAREPRSVARPDFAPLRSGRKSDAVFAQIHDFIRRGRFEPGSRLPPERELATMFNASRPTIREALYRAELLGLIAVRHGTGSVVVSSSPREPLDRPLIELIRSEAHRVVEFFEIRRLVEGWCAAQAAKMARAEDLRRMKTCLDDMARHPLDDAAWEAHDIAFHIALAAATGNPLAVRIVGQLRDGFAAFYRFKQFIPNKEDHLLIWRHHFDIYDAVRRRAPEEARQALVAHMDFIERALSEGIKGIGELGREDGA